jgi:hypothetical protein
MILVQLFEKLTWTRHQKWSKYMVNMCMYIYIYRYIYNCIYCTYIYINIYIYIKYTRGNGTIDTNSNYVFLECKSIYTNV